MEELRLREFIKRLQHIADARPDEDLSIRLLTLQNETGVAKVEMWANDSGKEEVHIYSDETDPNSIPSVCGACEGAGWYPAWGGLNLDEEIEKPCPSCSAPEPPENYDYAADDRNFDAARETQGFTRGRD